MLYLYTYSFYENESFLLLFAFVVILSDRYMTSQVRVQAELIKCAQVELIACAQVKSHQLSMEFKLGSQNRNL